MRVHTKVEYEWVEDGEDVYLRVVNEEGFDYEGPVARPAEGLRGPDRGGRISSEPCDQQAQTGQDMLNFWKQGYNTIAPMATQRFQTGLPFCNSLTDYTGGHKRRGVCSRSGWITTPVEFLREPAVGIQTTGVDGLQC